MNLNNTKHAVAVMKWLKNMKWIRDWNEMNWNELKTWNEACSSSNEMNRDVMKHAVAVMKWIEILCSMQKQ